MSPENCACCRRAARTQQTTLPLLLLCAKLISFAAVLIRQKRRLNFRHQTKRSVFDKVPTSYSIRPTGLVSCLLLLASLDCPTQSGAAKAGNQTCRRQLLYQSGIIVYLVELQSFFPSFKWPPLGQKLLQFIIFAQSAFFRFTMDTKL